MSNQTSSQGANASLAIAGEKEREEEKESVLDKVRRNIEKLKEVKRNEGGSFLRFQPGEVKILQFTGDIEPVQRTFKNKKDDGKEEKNEKIMYAYKVLDMRDQDKGIQVWEVSRSWSDSIDNLLVKGFLTLEVKREGAGTNTSYLFAPVVSANTSIKGS
jgi:hypothetical protein